MIRFSKAIVSFLGWIFSIGFTVTVIIFFAGVLMFNHYSKDLPDYSQLAQYDPATTTRLYAADGKFLAEYATEKRVFVPLSAIPKTVIDAFLSAEDKNFYTHSGIDITGLGRAVVNNIKNYGQGKSLVGGSTITQQVVKNFLLSNEKSMERKIKEAILSMRISKVYSKDKILELYLNEIYLGLGSYGVAAAAQNYFNKSMDELTVEEAALLATQPKAPALYNPHRNYDAAKERRDWVIERMEEDGRITSEQAKLAKETPIVLRKRSETEIAKADFFAEEVRRTLSEMYGSNVLYGGGLVVKTTLNPELQRYADKALQKALIDYDRRRGYRGAITNIKSEKDWKTALATKTKEHSYLLLENQRFAAVTALDDQKAQIMFEDNSKGSLPFSLMKWTRRVIADGKIGAEVKRPADILKIGDVLIAADLSEEEEKIINPKKAADKKKSKDKKSENTEKKNIFSLAQVPEVNGAMVVLDPHTGRVLAMSGGYAYGGTEFNRATQAKRQPGSAFKPFVYMAALENGFTPASVVLDAPVEQSQGEGLAAWKPSNYKGEYLGELTLRVALEKSRNTVTVRIAQAMGLDKVLEIGKRFGIYDDPAPHFSIVLGATETTLMRLVNAYGMIVNGGKRITPALIERIDDRNGQTIFRRDTRICSECKIVDSKLLTSDIQHPELADVREQVADPRVIYQIKSILQGAATSGTGARAYAEIKKIVGGKTGTTNDSLDTWFVGFSPDLVAGVYVGFDKPRTLGRKETGSSVALPAFISFMKDALADVPNKPFSIPRGIQLVKIVKSTGQPLDGTEPPDAKIIDEAFAVGDPIYVPGRSQEDIVLNKKDEGKGATIIDGQENESVAPTTPIDSGGGLY